MFASLLEGIGKAILFFFVTKIGAVISGVFVAIGLGYGAYQFFVAEWVALITSYFGGIPTLMLQTISFLKVDVAITIILSAVATRASMRFAFRRLANGGPF